MTAGEKIRYYREMYGLSQEKLGQLADINSATIKKYEYGIRNPKIEQLKKIADAFGISICLFLDFDIETVSDIMSLLFKLEDETDMCFEAIQDDAGNFIPESVKLSFQNQDINERLCTYLKEKHSLEEKCQKAGTPLDDDLTKLKIHLSDDSMVTKKKKHC